MKEWASLVSQMVKNLPAKQKTIPSWEDPLEDNVTTHSNIPAWRIPVDRGAWWAPHERMNDFCWQ